MGGLGSGRTRRHTCIDDCLTIDTTWLRKQKILGEQVSIFTLTWKHWTETNFVERKEHQNEIAAYYLHSEHPTLSLHYRTVMSHNDGRPKQEYSHQVTITLENTPCNYGSVRWWFTAPCCGRRVRVLYINQKIGDITRMTPQCRTCLDLHYASQMASYIERHKTYERYLLANYGLYWTQHRYDFELKEHYLEMTPALWALRLKAVIDWNMKLLKEVIRCDLMFYRSDLRNLKSLRSEEDRRTYLADMKARQLNTEGFIRIVYQCIEYERLTCALRTGAAPETIKQIYTRLAVLSREKEESKQVPLDAPAHIEDVEQKIISLETMLRQINKSERQAA